MEAQRRKEALAAAEAQRKEFACAACGEQIEKEYHEVSDGDGVVKKMHVACWAKLNLTCIHCADGGDGGRGDGDAFALGDLSLGDL